MPAVQLRHPVLPGSAVNLPGAQSVHVGWPGLAAYEPGKHITWLVAPTAHDEPAGQVRQSPALCKPVLLENEPASHDRGEETPGGQ